MMETVLFIVIAGLLFAFLIVRMAIRHEDRKLALKAQSKGAGENFAQLEKAVASANAEIEALRQRVQVLEKLATDDDRRLAAEISRLASTRSAAGG